MSQPFIGGASAQNSPPLLRQRWQTINPAHAIQSAAVVLGFPEDVPSFLVQRLVGVLRPVAQAAGLIKEEAVNASLIQIGPGGVQSAAPMTQTGTAFQKVRGAQVVEALNVTKNNIRFETSDYTRWIAMKDQLHRILDACLPVLSHATTLQSVGMEYVDFFFAASEGAEDVGLIIDNQSQLIAKRAFRKRDPFHSHSGWFERETNQSRFLVNVDVSIADAMGPIGQRRAITIRTFEAEQVIDVASGRAIELLETIKVIEAVEALHVSLKARLGALLTRDAKAMISLGN